MTTDQSLRVLVTSERDFSLRSLKSIIAWVSAILIMVMVINDLLYQVLSCCVEKMNSFPMGSTQYSGPFF